LVHPDKCKHPKAEEAFAILAKAQEFLLEAEKKSIILEIVEDARDAVRKRKRIKSTDPQATTPQFEEEVKGEIKKLLMEEELRRRKSVKRIMESEGKEQQEQQKKILEFKEQKEKVSSPYPRFPCSFGNSPPCPFSKLLDRIRPGKRPAIIVWPAGETFRKSRVPRKRRRASSDRQRLLLPMTPRHMFAAWCPATPRQTSRRSLQIPPPLSILNLSMCFLPFVPSFFGGYLRMQSGIVVSGIKELPATRSGGRGLASETGLPKGTTVICMSPVVHTIGELSLPTTCSACCVPAGTDVKISLCSKCRVVGYCSVSCQRKDWGEHKAECATFLSFQEKLKEKAKEYGVNKKVTVGGALNPTVRLVARLLRQRAKDPALVSLVLSVIKNQVKNVFSLSLAC